MACALSLLFCCAIARFTGELCSVIDFARKNRTVSLPALVRASHQAPAFEAAGVFSDASTRSRSLCELIMSSTLRNDMQAKKLVVAGWLLSLIHI